MQLRAGARRYLPKHVEFYISEDDESYKSIISLIADFYL